MRGVCWQELIKADVDEPRFSCEWLRAVCNSVCLVLLLLLLVGQNASKGKDPASARILPDHDATRM